MLFFVFLMCLTAFMFIYIFVLSIFNKILYFKFDLFFESIAKSIANLFTE